MALATCLRLWHIDLAPFRHNQAAQLQVYSGSYSPTVRAGSVQLLTGRVSTAPTTLLRPSSGTVAPNGALTIPLTTTP